MTIHYQSPSHSAELVILIIECVQQLNCTRMVVVEQQVIYSNDLDRTRNTCPLPD